MVNFMCKQVFKETQNFVGAKRFLSLIVDEVNTIDN
jgi:hypothetical protein